MGSKTFEDVWAYIGRFGYGQIFLVFLASWQIRPDALNNFTVVFTEKVPEHRCRVPFLEDFGLNQTEIELLAIPSSKNSCNETVFDECSTYDINWESE